MEKRHATVLAIILGVVATQASSYCIIGMDFAINIYDGLKIVYRFKHGGNISKEQGDFFMIFINLIVFNRHQLADAVLQVAFFADLHKKGVLRKIFL